MLITNNYCKRGYFRWGEKFVKIFVKILGKQLTCHGCNFHDTTPISFIMAFWLYFRVGVIFAKTKAGKTRKIPLCKNFHVYSILLCTDCFINGSQSFKEKNIKMLVVKFDSKPQPLMNDLSCVLTTLCLQWNYISFV